MVRLGLHVSIAGGIDRSVDRAAGLGCDLFQIFSRNPRGWASKPLPAEEAERFAEKLHRSGLEMAVVHMPYLPNLASPREDVYRRSVEALVEELGRSGMLSAPYLVTHLGSHLGSGWERGVSRIISALEAAFSRDDGDVILLLENTAGSRNSMGSTFQDMAAIIDALDGWRLGLCLDTCHLFAAGYELRTREGIDGTMDELAGCISLERLRLLHLNDSSAGLGSHLDRHEHIGLGMIGEEGFRNTLSHPALRGLPMILETPVDSRRNDPANLQAARDLASE
ncbi:MAG: deoxyribonuclease IV [Methanothrix sp.]|nr:deoxyribonuclease IV [Methanothrix sp.]